MTTHYYKTKILEYMDASSDEGGVLEDMELKLDRQAEVISSIIDVLTFDQTKEIANIIWSPK